MGARENWRAAHRAARIHRKHRIAGFAEVCRLGEGAALLVAPAIRSIAYPEQVWAYGIESARRVRRLGLSASKCLFLHRRAVLERAVRRRYETIPKFPATRFTLSRVAFL